MLGFSTHTDFGCRIHEIGGRLRSIFTGAAITAVSRHRADRGSIDGAEAW